MSEFGLGGSLPELTTDDFLELHDAEDSTSVLFLDDEARVDKVEDANASDAKRDQKVERDMQDMVEVLLRLSSNEPTPSLQEQDDSAMAGPLPDLSTRRHHL